MIAIDTIAESYRVKLGLLTWEKQKAWADDLRERLQIAPPHHSDQGRRSGRTTRAMLEKIAIAVHTVAPMILVKSPRKAIREACIFVAVDLLRRLEITDIEVRAWSRRAELVEHVLYVDHHDAERGTT